MINIESAFNDLSVNAIVATNFMDLLGLNTMDFHDPVRFSRFQQVVQYLKQFPDDTQRFLITKSTRGKPVDKLDQVFEYTNLLKQKYSQEQTLDDLKKQILVLEVTGDPKLNMIQLQKEEMDKQIDMTLLEIGIYEK